MTFIEGRLRNAAVNALNVSSNTTLDGTYDLILVDCSGSPVTVTLPAASEVEGKAFTFKKTDVNANALTVTAAGSDTIDGSASIALSTQYFTSRIASDGSNWFQTDVEPAAGNGINDNEIYTALGLSVGQDVTDITYDTTNYVSDGTSYKDAISALDAQLKTTTDAVNAVATDDVTALLGAVGINSGQTVADLNYSSNWYVTDGTSLETAVGALDTSLFNITPNIGYLFDIAGLTQGQGEANINYSSNNYITDGVDFMTSLGALDAQVKTNYDNHADTYGRLDSLFGAVGLTVFDNEASINYSSNNYVVDGTDLITSVGLLDSRAGTDAANITAAESKISNLFGIAGLTTSDDETGINYSSNTFVTDGTDFMTAIGALDSNLASTLSQVTQKVSILCDITVDLTAGPLPKTTTLYTAVSNNGAVITDVLLIGNAAITGSSKSTTMKIGTAGNSYSELLNGSTGHTFATGTATSLLPASSVVRVTDLYPPATMSVAGKGKFAQGTILAAELSGDLMDTGSVRVVLLGWDA